MNDADAADAEQITWLRLAENHHRVRHPERIGGWLATTASRECLRILRRTWTDMATADSEGDVERPAVDAETAAQLWDAVEAMPPRRRAVLHEALANDPTSSARIARATWGAPEEGWESLTDAELGVVRLLADGLTNREIAQRLFLSPRTVQTHVAHVLSKLGMSRRAEIAAEASRRLG